MDIFYALAEPRRRSILEMLASHGKLTATDICNKFQVSASAISQHLKVLREANLVHMEKRAQQRVYEINREKMLELEEWAKKLSIIWDERFNALDVVLEEEKKKLENSK